MSLWSRTTIHLARATGSIHADPMAAPAVVRHAMSRRGSTRCPFRISPTTCPHHGVLVADVGAADVQPLTNGSPLGLKVTLEPRWSTRSTKIWSGARARPVESATHARPRASRERNETVRSVVRTVVSPSRFSTMGARAPVEPSARVTGGREPPHAAQASRTATTSPVAREGRGWRPVPPSCVFSGCVIRSRVSQACIATQSSQAGARRRSRCLRDTFGSRCSCRTPHLSLR